MVAKEKEEGHERHQVPAANLPAVVDALGAALQKAAANVLPAHYNEDHEKAQILYMQIRQKPLMDEKGRTIRPPGAFRIGKKDDLSYEDKEELLITILGFRPGRVYFRDLNSPKPDCRSDDMIHGSRQAETINGKRVFGECASCWFGQWGSGIDGKRQACGENRRLFVVDWSNERPLVLTLGRSSIRTFAAYDNFVTDQARKNVGADKEGRVPSIHHLLLVTARLIYKDKPAGHYVVELLRKDEAGNYTSPIALRADQQKMMADLWESSMDGFKKAVQNQEYEAEDVVGNEADKEVPF